MLCEGFYLHTVLVSAFVSEQKLTRWLIGLGWSFPAVVILPYSLLRGLHGDLDDTKQLVYFLIFFNLVFIQIFRFFYSCWNDEGVYNNVLVAPVCLSMFLNLLFLCNIVRVLLLKLKAPAGLQAGGPSRTVLQAFR